MEIFRVGGAVRDQLLGLKVNDFDYVVVGATPEEMRNRGFRAVGKDFPVFIHPKTGEEYALARTERKSGKGYTGFQFHASPDVTLEEDLLRRDLTINAIAEDENGELIDPYNGYQDLKNRILRHVSPAFSEDPLRVIRVARFYAKLAPFDFQVAPDTFKLMENITASGELDTLTKERLWQETVKALKTEKPHRFFALLECCGALKIVMPEVTTKGISLLKTLSTKSEDPLARFAVVFIDADKVSLKAPKSYLAVQKLFRLHHQYIIKFMTLSSEEKLKLIKQLDGLRRPERLESILTAAQVLDINTDTLSKIKQALKALNTLDFNALTQKFKGTELAKAIEALQIQTIHKL